MAHERKPQPEMEPEHDPDAQARSAAPSPGGSADLLGQTLAGRYRFEALMGEGTFARVYRVFDEHRRATLAAKVLRSDIAHEPTFLARFRREAHVLERLQHPHIVRYYDIVESGDTVFILTDHISGRTLQTELRRLGRPLTPGETLTYLKPLAAALHFAHQEGIVHRDLKPANILLDDSNKLYITDFGIARILSDASTLTVDTTVGTPHYMSPEQIMAGQVTVTTDVYALGIVLYQMLTGQLPFTGDSPDAVGTTTAMRIVYEHLHLRPTPPRQLKPALSSAAEAVILRCLEKDPAQRYQSVSAVYDALAAALGAPAGALDEEARHQLPAAERVPTGVGGASRILPESEYAGAEGLDEEAVPKPKRKAKREARRREPQGEKEEEKDREKEQDSQEKSDEKTREKGREVNVEKGEFWGDIGPGDRLSQLTWGGAVLWAGIVLLLGLSHTWGWIFAGAGALLFIEVAARMIIPEYRAKPGARLMLGTVLLMVGLGMGVGFGSLWPLILIGIGVSLLVNRLFE
ncbi:MAG: protein kinase [Anaerolineae bacterium]|nr:protein kinase [Anaerolineae bacterium]